MDLKSLRRFYTGREWLYDKNEYYRMLNTIIVDNCEIALEPIQKGKKKGKLPEVVPLTKKETMKWLALNNEYKLELDNLGKKSACDPRIVEIVCYFKRLYKNPMDFKKAIEIQYPEMTFDTRNQSLIGSWNGEHFSLICDSLFDNRAQRFVDEMKQNPTLYLYYRYKKNSKDKFKRATIGEFLEEMDKVFNVKIDQRFKGKLAHALVKPH